MAIEANMQFSGEIRNKLGSVLTADDRDKVMRIIDDVLCNYDLTRRIIEEAGDDFLTDLWINALTVEGRSAQTITRYKYILNKLFKHAKVNTRSITAYHVRNYLSAEKARGISDSTLNGERTIFSSYFGWLYNDSLIEKNPMANIGVIKHQKKVKLAYSDVDFERLKMQCETPRDRAIICFLASTGCRIHEVTQLNRDDVDIQHMECKVLGKGNKERRVYLDAVSAMMLKEYLDGREDNCEALFIGKGDRRLECGGVRKMLNRLGLKAGVDHVHPHKFRRTLATNLIKHGMPIQDVAAILGHEKIDTTMRYVVLDNTQIKSEYQRYT